MTRENIARRIMCCTPRKLQAIIDYINYRKDDFIGENCENIKTVQELIDVMTSLRVIKEAKLFEYETGEDYFRAVLNI